MDVLFILFFFLLFFFSFSFFFSSDQRVFVSGPAAFGKTGPAYVHEYDLSGTLVHTYLITFQNPFIPFRAASCLVTRKEQGIEYVYVIEPFVGIVRITVDGQDAGAQVLFVELIQPKRK